MKYLFLISNWHLKYLLLTVFFIKIFGVFFAIYIFQKFSPLVDSNLYLQGAMSNDLALRTRIVNSLASSFNVILGDFLSHFIFSLISIAGYLYYYLSGGRHWILLPLLLLPSSLIWTSVVGKEAIFFGFVGVAIVIWSKYVVMKITFLDCMFLLFSLTICTLFRPHYAIFICWLFYSIFILKIYNQKAKYILLISFLFLIIFLYFFIFNELLLRGFGGIDPFARSSRHDLFQINPFTGEGFLKFKSLILIGFIFGIVGPLPSELFANYKFLPFFIEGIFIFIMPIIVVYLANTFKIKELNLFHRIFVLSILPSILIVIFVHAPFGILNPGSAIRWRVNFELLFYFAPTLLLLRFLDVSTKENSSLSSKW